MVASTIFRRALFATAAFAGVCVSQTAFATAAIPCQTGAAPSNVTSCSTGVYVNLAVLNLIGLTVGPVANAFGTAPAPYNVTTTLASANAGGSLVAATLGLSTGLITDTASSPFNGSVSTLSSTATSTVNSLSLNLNAVVVSLLHISSGTLSSTSTASNITGLGKTFTGSSYIQNLVVSALGATTFTGSITAATSANYNVLSVAGLDVIANYQSPIYFNGNDQIGIQTAALAIEFNNYGFASGLTHQVLNGTIFIADSAAAVPEPATWAMMLFGFGLVGAMARQRRTLALA